MDSKYARHGHHFRVGPQLSCIIPQKRYLKDSRTMMDAYLNLGLFGPFHGPFHTIITEGPIGEALLSSLIPLSPTRLHDDLLWLQQFYQRQNWQSYLHTEPSCHGDTKNTLSSRQHHLFKILLGKNFPIPNTILFPKIIRRDFNSPKTNIYI